MKKKLSGRLLAGFLAVFLAIPLAATMPGIENVVYAAEGLSVRGVIGTNIDGGSLINPNPQFGWYLVPGTEDVRLLFEINDDKKSVSLTHNTVHYDWLDGKNITVPTLSIEIPAYVDGYPVTRIDGGIDNLVYQNFAFCYINLTDIIIPNTVTTLGAHLFSGKSITKVALPDSIINIGASCFSDSKIESIVIPRRITKIANDTFGGCENLTSITLPDGLTEIGTMAFFKCKSAADIIIPSSVQKIGSDAFRECSSLKNIVIPDGVTEINARTFRDCTSLASITIPVSVGRIATEAFYNTPALKTVNYKGTPEQWKKIEMAGSVKNTMKSAIITCSDGSKIVGGKVQTPSPSGDDEKPGDDKDKNDGENKQASVKSVTLSATKYTYDGKAKKPSITAIDNTGKRIDKKYYTLSYKNNKNVGQATVTVKFKGDYSGTVKKTFIIKPARTTISKVTGKSKSMTLKWKKNTKQVSGYQIQYSTTSKFKKGTTASVYIKKASTTTRTIKKLKGKKKYYVRIRTYKIAKVNGKSMKLFSSWSLVKQVVTKR